MSIDRPTPREPSEQLPQGSEADTFELHITLPYEGETPADCTPVGGEETKGPAIKGYRLLGVLGKGGMGVVYKAHQIETDRLIALKMMRVGLCGDAELRDRFGREARALGQFQHPNIVQIFEVGEYDEFPFFVMEYVEGGSLAAKLKQAALPFQEAAALMQMLATAMDLTHQKGLLHRDLKPSNVLLGQDGTPKITDFGLVKQLAQDSDGTETGVVLGTPSYMAPEQAMGRIRDVGPWTDVYGLGAILYELLTGKPPFQAGNRIDTMTLVIREEPTPPSRLVRGVPRDLEAICLKCLEKVPARRYHSAGALANDLACWLKGEPTQVRPAGPLRRVLCGLRKHPWLTLLGTLVLVGALAVPWARHHYNPERPRLELEAALAQGQPVTLIADTGKPRYFRWEVTNGELREPQAGDGSVAFSSMGTCLLELVSDPRHSSYRFEAMIRHDDGSELGEVGLYFGHRKSVTFPGAHAFCRLAFADRGRSASRKVGPEGEVGSRVELSWDFLDVGPSQLPGRTASLGKGLFFEPANPVGRPGPWRKLAIQITPSQIETFWAEDGKELQPVHVVPFSSLQMRSISLRRELEKTGLPTEFEPRAPLGIYVHRSALSVKQALICPLPQTALKENQHATDEHHPDRLSMRR